MRKYCNRVSDVNTTTHLDEKDRTGILNMKEGQKKKIRFTEAEFNFLLNHRNDNGDFTVKYAPILADIKKACKALGIPYRKGQGTHALRYDKVADETIILKEQGLDDKTASALITRELAHFRKSADAPYRPPIETVLGISTQKRIPED